MKTPKRKTDGGGSAAVSALVGQVTLASRYEAILAAVPDIIVEVDTRRVYAWANQAAFDFFGLDLLGREASFFFAGAQDTYRRVQPMFEGDRSVFYVESWQRRCDGQKRLLAWWCRALTAADGTVTGALSTARDITDSRHEEEALRESEAVQRALIDGNPESLVLVDTDGRILAANEAMARRLGRTRDDVVGLVIGSLMPAEIAQSRWAKAEEVIRTGLPVHFEDSRNGRHFHNSMQPVKDPAGKVVRISILARDITERKLTEDALRQSEARYRQLHESLMDAFVCVTMDGHITEFNETFRCMLGYSAAELRQLRYTDLTPEKWHAFETAIVRDQILPRGYSDIYEKEYRRKDGQVFPVELRTVLLRDAEGQPSAMWAIVRDISDRKRAESALQRAHAELEHKVEQRTARLRELAEELTRTEHRERRRIADLLHEDLQQLLVAAKCRIAGLRGSSSGGTHPQQSLDDALKAVDDALQLARDLSVDLRPPVLNELGLKSALEWLANDTETRYGLVVRVTVKAVPDPVSEEVRVFVHEAVRELLLNVVKHAGVREALVQVSTPDRQHIRLTVSDRGTGFDAQQTQGWGIGLFNIRERVRTLAGQFEISSEPGTGTTATLTLPRVVRPRDQAAKAV